MRAVFTCCQEIGILERVRWQSAQFTIIIYDRAHTMDFQSYKDEVQGFVERGNYHAAINIALPTKPFMVRTCNSLTLVRVILSAVPEFLNT